MSVTKLKYTGHPAAGGVPSGVATNTRRLLAPASTQNSRAVGNVAFCARHRQRGGAREPLR